MEVARSTGIAMATAATNATKTAPAASELGSIGAILIAVTAAAIVKMKA